VKPYSNSNLSLYYHILATRALYSSSIILSSAIGVCITKALNSASTLLVRAILVFGSSFSPSAFTFTFTFSIALLRFRPCFTLFTVASFTFSVKPLRFRPRLPLPLASLIASFLARFARAS
jgi:hypothetical protein